MKAEPETFGDLDQWLESKWMAGLWNVGDENYPLHPRTTVKPHVWRWADIHEGLLQARSIGVKSGSQERRSIWLINPGVCDIRDTSHTMHIAFQLIQPGEVAPAHRHTMAAIRFILQGKGAYTTVAGQKMVMEEGDLILTPQSMWHEHAHEGGEPMIWMDGLDLPLIQSLRVISFERYPEMRIPVRNNPDLSSHYGMVRPVTSEDEKILAPLHYHWRDVYHSLKSLAEGDPNPYEGIALEYCNPLTGGPTLPTLSCLIQMLRPGERTRVHRHTSTSIYHAFRGSGTTMVDGEAIHWEKGDTFIVPLWSWHEHANSSSKEEALLFSLHDTPVLKAFGLYREEGQGESHLAL